MQPEGRGTRSLAPPAPSAPSPTHPLARTAMFIVQGSPSQSGDFGGPRTANGGWPSLLAHTHKKRGSRFRFTLQALVPHAAVHALERDAPGRPLRRPLRRSRAELGRGVDDLLGPVVVVVPVQRLG